MDPHRLLGDELTYELKIRGVTSITGVDKMRKYLRGLISLERQNKCTIPLGPTLSLNPAEEIPIIKEKLVRAKELVSTFSGTKSDSEYKKADTLVTHLHLRISRLNVSEDSNLLDSYKALQQEILDLVVALEDKVKAGTVDPSATTAIPIASDTPGTVMEAVDTYPSLPTEQPYAPGNPYRARPIPTKDWNLTFSGDGKGLSLQAFLEDVDIYKVARNNSDEDLFKGAIDLFSGTALLWFKSTRKEIRSWSELVDKLKSEFEDEDYQHELLMEAMHRTQGPDEHFGAFISIMKTYFSRLERQLSEEERLRILFRNVTPYFYERLRPFRVKTVLEFAEAGRQIQHDKLHMEKYKPPPRSSKKTLLAPELAYTG